MLYQIVANGSIFSVPIVKISISDNVGIMADDFSVTIPYDETIDFPNTGAVITISLGIDELFEMGTYIVDRLEVSGTPNLLTISGRGIPKNLSSQSFLQNRDYVWESGTTLERILKWIADRHGYSLRISEEAGSIIAPFTHQSGESDASFLHKILSERDLIMKFYGNVMAVTFRDAEQSASGINIPKANVGIDEIMSYSHTVRDISSYNSVTAKWQDYEHADIKTVTVGDGPPNLTLNKIFPGITLATQAANSELRNSQRKNKIVNFVIPFKPEIVAGAGLNLMGFPFQITDEFIIMSVKHDFSNRYIMSVNAEKKVI